MARVTQIELDCVMVEGAYDTVYVLTSLDEISGATYQVINSQEVDYGVYGDRDVAVDKACFIADASDAELNQQGN